MMKAFSQFQGEELIWGLVKFGHFALESQHGDVYGRYQMKGLSTYLVEAEDGSWKFHKANFLGTSYVVTDQTGKIVATIPWVTFKKTHVALEDGRTLRIARMTNYGVCLLDSAGELITGSQEMSRNGSRPKIHVTIGPAAHMYPELSFLIPLCNYLRQRATAEESQMHGLGSIFTMGWSKFE